MQGTSKQAPIQLGRLSADDAERFAAMFRPAWELDDAPFASGTKLSASEMDALAAPAGIAVDIATAAAVAPHFPPKSHGSAPEAESIEIQMDPTPPPAPRAAPPVVAARPPVPVSAPVAARPQPQAYVPPPRPITDDDLSPPKKSSMGIFIGAGVLVALVGIGVVAKFALGSADKTSTTTTTTQTATQEERRIPPPPAAVDTTPPADTVAAKPPADKGTTTAAPVVATTPPPVATTPPPIATATHAAAAAGGGGTAPHATSTGGGTKPPPIATTKTNKSGIVRDNPF